PSPSNIMNSAWRLSMGYNPENPLIVQSDMTVLLETMGPHYEAAREYINQFAELTKSPEYLHTYTITPLSIWNAASAGITLEQITEGFNRFAKYDVPQNVVTETRELLGRFGSIQLLKDEATDQLFLRCRELAVAEEILAAPAVREL